MRATLGAAGVVAFFLVMQAAGGLALTGFGWFCLVGAAALAVYADVRKPAELRRAMAETLDRP